MTASADGLGAPRRTTVAGLAALVAGQDDAPAVLMLPGYTGSKEDFVAILPPLAAAGLRAVAVDLRGQYESAYDGDGPDSQFAVDALAADVALAAAELGGRVHLVGHSFGGLVARAALIAHPAALGSVVLLGSGPAAIVGPRRLGLRALIALHAQAGLAAVWEGARAVDTVVRSPEEVEFLRRRFFASSERGMLAMGAALLAEPDRVADAAAVAATHAIPLLVTHGVGDDAWPPGMQAEMATRLGARYAVIPDALHSPAAQNPAGTADVLIAFVRDAIAGPSTATFPTPEATAEVA
ncbi:alpha/beta fold hydrolase [Pseudofrankia asymbiotica]|uniref:alpha/beta fold hydrolase n=1 Tax=Pseudofrankia asymbiotica TaxID=1834516 RepID=UPI0009D6611B|nr:alpha/beta fold hydrolase [Pseudofrankia asymbiotica]